MAGPVYAPGQDSPARDGLVGSLLHGLAILDMFERNRQVISLPEIAETLGVHRSSASRLAATLAAAGYLQPAGEKGKYRLAGKLAALGALATGETDLRQAVLPRLRDLVEQCGETGHLGILDGAEAVTVEVVDGWHTVRMHSWIGKRSAAHCTSMGKSLLAGVTDERLRAIYPNPRLEKRTPTSITDRADLERRLAQIRTRGYADDLEELETGLCCVAAPVFDGSGKVTASISVSGPSSRINETTIPALARDVRQTAWHISQRLGAPRHISSWAAPAIEEIEPSRSG